MSSIRLKNLFRLAALGLILSIIGNGVLFIQGTSPFNLTRIDKTFDAKANNIQNVIVNSSSDKIVVIQSADDQFHFRLVGKLSHTSKPQEFKHDLSTDLDTLKFNLPDNLKQQFALLYNSYHLEVSIPKGHLKHILIKSKSGDIILNDIQSELIEIENSSGNIEARHLSGHMKLTNRNGDTRLILDKLESNLSFVNTSGNFEFILEQAPQALETKLQTRTGVIKQKLPTMLIKDTINMDNQQNGLIGSNGPVVEGSTKSGDITISLLK